MAELTYKQMIFSRYLSSGFRKMNALDYELAGNSYELNFGDIITVDRNARILDVGCGMGHFLYYLKKKGYVDFLGIEVGREQVEYCKSNITDKIEEVADIFKFLPGKPDFYDLIVLNDVLEHFNKEDVFRLLRAVLISLKDGGRLIIKTPNMGNLFGIASLCIDFTHEVGFSEVSLRQVLQVTGFKEVNCREEKVYISSFFKRVAYGIFKSIYRRVIKFVIFLDRPGDNYPNIISKNLIVFADK